MGRDSTQESHRIIQECSMADGAIYRVDHIRLTNSREHGIVYSISIQVSKDHGVKWEDLPMSLSVWSRVRYPLSLVWPPENAFDLFETPDRNVGIRFWNEPAFGVDDNQCSIWEAVYRPIKQYWTIKHIRHLKDGENKVLYKQVYS